MMLLFVVEIFLVVVVFVLVELEIVFVVVVVLVGVKSVVKVLSLLMVHVFVGMMMLLLLLGNQVVQLCLVIQLDILVVAMEQDLTFFHCLLLFVKLLMHFLFVLVVVVVPVVQVVLVVVNSLEQHCKDVMVVVVGFGEQKVLIVGMLLVH